MAEVLIDFISVGGNRHPASADWDHSGSGILAFGAQSSIALWKPQVIYSIRKLPGIID